MQAEQEAQCSCSIEIEGARRLSGEQYNALLKHPALLPLRLKVQDVSDGETTLLPSILLYSSLVIVHPP